jgi:hypothetical protein
VRKSELIQNLGLFRLAGSLLVGLWAVTPGWVNALPNGGEIVSGIGSIQQPSAQDLVIQQDTQRDIDVNAVNINVDESSFNETRDLILNGNLIRGGEIDAAIEQATLGTFLTEFFENGGPGGC